MGAHHSKQSQKLVEDIVNKSTTDVVSKTVSDNTVGSVSNVTIDISDLHADGSVNLGTSPGGIKMVQAGKVDFTAISKTVNSNNFGTKMAQNIMDQLSQKQTSESLNLDMGSSKSKSDIQKTIKNIVSTHITTTNIQKCAASMMTNMSLRITHVTAGQNITLGAVDMEQTSSLMAHCLASADTVNKIVNDMSTASSTMVSQTQKQTGVVGDAGRAVSGALDSIGKMLPWSGLSGGGSSTSISASCSCCCCCILLLIIFGVIAKEMSSPGSMAKMAMM
jgi:hypothetical protein